MYIPTNYGSFPLVAEAGAKMGNQLLSINVGKRPQDPAPRLEGAGSYLLAWDPVARKEVWQQRAGQFTRGRDGDRRQPVFQAWTRRRSLLGIPCRHRRAASGRPTTQANIVGGAASYEIDGEQYVAVVAAGQGGRGGGYWAPNYARLLVYKLGGDATLPSNGHLHAARAESAAALRRRRADLRSASRTTTRIARPATATTAVSAACSPTCAMPRR